METLISDSKFDEDFAEYFNSAINKECCTLRKMMILKFFKNSQTINS